MSADQVAHESETYSFAAYYPDDQSVRLSDWGRKYGVSRARSDQQCWELGDRVGTPTAMGVLCLSQRVREFSTLGRIYRLEGTALREVWRATLRTYSNWLELTPVLATDGTLVLHDRSLLSCESAISEISEKAMSGEAPPWAHLVKPACAKRGRYRYQDGQYRLVEPVPLGRIDSRY